MPTLITSVFNQKVFPKAGDVDDCWVVSAFQCARASAPWIPMADVTWLRGAAGDPDDGVTDGGNSGEIMRMAQRMWPDIRVVNCDGKTWTWLLDRLKGSLRAATIGVMSSVMPSSYRFGFLGAHQITIFWEEGALWMANPLAPQGSKPIKVNPTYIEAAAKKLTGNDTIRAVIFPTREEATATRVRYTQGDIDRATQIAKIEAEAAFKQQITDITAAMDAAVARLNTARTEIKNEVIAAVNALP